MNDTALPELAPDKAAKFRTLFFDEATELLQDVERSLQQSLDGISDDATASTLFRAIHSIKGGAAAFGMRRVVGFAHVFETTLEELRRGSFKLDNIRRHMFLRCHDMLTALLNAEANQEPRPEGAETELLKSLEGLNSLAVAMRADPERSQVASYLPPELKASTTIRIELAKIDRLVNLASELTMVESMLRQRAEATLAPLKRTSDADSLMHGLDQLGAQLRLLQEAAMQTRAQPLDSVFQRLPYIVRELSESLGKEVDLFMTGGEIGVDRTIIEQLAEPLTHIMRNAIDHGIESVPARLEQGKPAQGTIGIAAHCTDNRLLLTIKDDGRGLNLPALREKAAARQLDISDDALADLIFMPGFSTADKISEISGRGMGLDIVKHNLMAVGGTITVNSAPGAGSCFTISLPLSLAVMDGMIIDIDRELYVLPLADVQEMVNLSPDITIRRNNLPTLIRQAARYVSLIDTNLLLGRDPARRGG